MLKMSSWLLNTLHAIVVRLHVCKINVVILTQLVCLHRNLSLSVGFFIQDEAMDVVRSAPQEARYHADVI